MAKKFAQFAAAAFIATAAYADTITTDVGVTFDGVVTETPDGNYKITAGDNVLFYQKSEIVSIEKNDKTGKLDMEKVAEEARKADAELTEKTGLDQSQRARVEALLPQLMEDGPGHIHARDTLVAMAGECDIYKYLEFVYVQSTPFLQIQLLDVLIHLDSNRAVPQVRESLTNSFPGVREKAIEMLAAAGDASSVDKIARGLVDPEVTVRIAATYALANLRQRAATPALIECLPHPDLRVSGAAREALATLWSDVIGDKRPANVDEWNAIWEANKKGVSGSVTLSQLEPLADPTVPFVAG